MFEIPGLAGALSLGSKEIVSVYGGGGKTSFLMRLAEELARESHKVIFTTTTKLRYPHAYPVVITSDFNEAASELGRLLREENIVALGSETLPKDKLNGVEPSWIGKLSADGLAPYILVEADGAAGKPMKGYAGHEPVLPFSSTLLVPLLGLDSVGSPLKEEFFHRPEILSEQIGVAEGGTISIHHLLRHLFFMIARGRRQAPSARFVSLLNKADQNADKTPVFAAAEACFAYPGAIRLLMTALADEYPLYYLFDNTLQRPFISCAILAAGFSRRMGEDKLSLRLGGKTILEHAVESAAGSGADEVFIVARPDQEWIDELFTPKKIPIIKNYHAAQGMSASLKTAISAVHPLSQGIIFALGDQPFIEPDVYSALIQSHRQYLNLVTYPLFQGQKGNPQLYDRKTWPLLLKLRGDQGGRGIVSILPEEEYIGVEVASPTVVADIDTVEEYNERCNSWEK